MIKNIIEGQRTELDRKLHEKYVHREAVLKGFDTDLISIVIGPRRAGKSLEVIHIC